MMGSNITQLPDITPCTSVLWDYITRRRTRL